jgi:WD40 repeat protein
MVVVRTDSKHVLLFDISTGKSYNLLPNSSIAAKIAVFSTDGKVLAIVSTRDTVWVWNIENQPSFQEYQSNALTQKTSFTRPFFFPDEYEVLGQLCRPSLSGNLVQADQSCISVQKDWVAWNGKNILRLHSDYMHKDSRGHFQA